MKKAGFDLQLDPVDAGGFTARTAANDYDSASIYYVRPEPDILILAACRDVERGRLPFGTGTALLLASRQRSSRDCAETRRFPRLRPLG